MGIYKLIKQDSNSKARLGEVSLNHGKVLTPAFMPVGTNGTVKGIYHEKLNEIGYQIILANTYHLYLRPGLEVLESYGGLHNFSSWSGNILTDSGGFQVFSLSKLRKIKESGIIFQSHIDGSKHVFTPEKVVDIQSIIGSDIAMVLDVCTPPGISYREAKEAWNVTKNWAERSLKEKEKLGDNFKGALFPIIQGNFYKDLRKESALTLSEMPFEGVAIGGLSVGEEKSQFNDFLSYTASFLPLEKPRYVMGIGSPDYILNSVENGIDLFDCVLATRMARNGSVFTKHGVIPLKKAKYSLEKGPIEEDCSCTCCKKYSLGYMHHLIKCNEMLGGMLATEHNLTFFYNFLQEIRKSIKEDRFLKYKNDFLKNFYC